MEPRVLRGGRALMLVTLLIAAPARFAATLSFNDPGDRRFFPQNWPGP